MSPDPTTSRPAPPAPRAAGARMPVALLGAGQVGRMHAARMSAHGEVELVGVADPAPAAREWAATLGVPWSAEPADLLDRVRPAAAVVAAPNQQHTAVALACIERGVVPLVEKPVAHTLASARELVAAAAAAGVPVLVGHQRRHGVAVQRARRLIEQGAIGRLVTAVLMATWFKPAPYFEMAWRREAGGGPVLINAIHDIDLLRFLAGEVESVQAMASHATRGFAVEDTAAAVMRLAGGALATLVVSDTAVSPWNYDLAAGESELYAPQPVDALLFSGSEGALSVPQLMHWRYRDGERHWHRELAREHVPLHRRDPYAEQLRHLRAVAEGREPPLCSAADGMATLAATLAVLQAAASGQAVHLGAPAPQPSA